MNLIVWLQITFKAAFLLVVSIHVVSIGGHSNSLRLLHTQTVIKTCACKLCKSLFIVRIIKTKDYTNGVVINDDLFIILDKNVSGYYIPSSLLYLK